MSETVYVGHKAPLRQPVKFQVLPLKLLVIHSPNPPGVDIYGPPHDEAAGRLAVPLDEKLRVFLGGPDRCRKWQLKADMEHV
ncbi:hypothetical protein GTU67_14575 [Pusillimonas sp. 7-48]|uniref:Uncharacterized protein n=1 Tax=Pusillimonas minor TaxID=2697024 RepID=A0A842HU15_9BURK|nr:hypothetical protein [Pusillimonas minor]